MSYSFIYAKKIKIESIILKENDGGKIVEKRKK